MTMPTSRCHGRWKRLWFVVCIAVACLGGIAWPFIRSNRSRSVESILTAAHRKLIGAQYADAESLARQALQANPTECRAALVAARAAIAQHRESVALDYLKPATEQGTPGSADCSRLAAEIAQRLGHAAAAEAFLRQAIWANPADIESANQLAYLLGCEGRAFEAADFLLLAIQQGRVTPHHLVMLAAGEPVVEDVAFVKRCLRAVPNDPLPQLGRARTALVEQDFAVAEPLLRTIKSAAPRDQEVLARWGMFIQQRGTESDFLEWNSRLPSDIWHPEIWIVRGQRARQKQEPHVAARCFWEALRRDPNHRLACYQLGQLLRELGQPTTSEACLTRAAKLEQLAFLVDRIYANPQAAQLMQEAALLTESLGRIWEAWGWAHCAAEIDPHLPGASDFSQRLLRKLQPELPRTLASGKLGDIIDLSNEPLPDWQPAIDLVQVDNGLSTAAQVRFENIAGRVGLNFVYKNGHNPALDTTRMFESIGGGVAVLDYDRDGWPDLYFPQGGAWLAEHSNDQHPDAMFRNHRGEACAEVTALACLGDCGFSQGSTIGDFNGDGFPDLYIANVGRNRLYCNLGDGTFEDVSDAAGIASARWTTSCLLADLNADGLPDLYDVNYLSIADAPRTLCVRGDEARTCGPGAFHAEGDQLYLNLGDGRYRDISKLSGIDIPNGKGLGIVAGDLSGTGVISLFVANDSVPNFLFVNRTSSPEDIPKFTEEALVSGLALSHDGLSAAWMGVAAGDANGDGRLDLFATTYANQSKSLFQQDPAGGIFNDVILQSGLNAPSWRQLGFGTQFLDGELDGWSDLVITNGHVFDLSHQNEAYEMPPQYFRNSGGGRFDEVPASQLGPFFAERYLGRGLARLDWDRDGRDDFSISHMNAPAPLVVNRTPQPGNSVVIRLVGTRTNRDAIGTRVIIQAGSRSWTQQLTAGDGFEASNERKLLFGLGPATRIDRLTVEWLSGTRTVIRDVDVNREWLIIEDQARPYAIAK